MEYNRTAICFLFVKETKWDENNTVIASIWSFLKKICKQNIIVLQIEVNTNVCFHDYLYDIQQELNTVHCLTYEISNFL